MDLGRWILSLFAMSTFGLRCLGTVDESAGGVADSGLTAFRLDRGFLKLKDAQGLCIQGILIAGLELFDEDDRLGVEEIELALQGIGCIEFGLGFLPKKTDKLQEGDRLLRGVDNRFDLGLKTHGVRRVQCIKRCVPGSLGELEPSGDDDRRFAIVC